MPEHCQLPASAKQPSPNKSQP